MSLTTDDELRQWTADWQTDETTAADVDAIGRLRDRVRQRSRRMALWTACEVVICVAMLGFLGAFFASHPAPLDRTVAVALGLVTVWALAFALWNRRGAWRPLGTTTADFLELSRLRLRRRLRGLLFGWWLLAAQLIVFVPWIWIKVTERAAAAGARVGLDQLLLPYGFLAFWTLVMVVASLVVSGRTRRELIDLDEVRAALADDGAGKAS